MENREENPRIAKVSFETPQEVVFLGEPETEILVDGDDGFSDDFDGARCVDSESQEHREEAEEQSPEPTTSK